MGCGGRGPRGNMPYIFPLTPDQPPFKGGRYLKGNPYINSLQGGLWRGSCTFHPFCSTTPSLLLI